MGGIWRGAESENRVFHVEERIYNLQILAFGEEQRHIKLLFLKSQWSDCVIMPQEAPEKKLKMIQRLTYPRSRFY